MSAARVLAGVVAVAVALLLQLTVLSRLPLPGAAPDLVLVLVVAFALAEGPASGTATGFAGGLAADLLADHQLGRLALAFALVGYLAGQVHDETERSTLLPFLVVGGAAAGAVLLYAATGVLVGDPRVGAAPLGRALVSSVPYAVVLTPFVVPLVEALVRRVGPGPTRGRRG